MTDVQLTWSAVKRLAPTIGLVAAIFTLGHLIPLPGISDADPFVQTGKTSGCLYSWAWIQCWTSYHDPRHWGYANALWALPIVLVGMVWIWCRLTNRKMIRETEE